MTDAPPTLPKPTALRLLGASGDPPTAPLGVTTWSADATDAAVLLERPADGAPPTSDAVAAQLPDPASLPAGALLVVLEEPRRRAGLLGRLLPGRMLVGRYVRGSALLAVGYERIGGGVDPRTGQDLAWGYVRDPSEGDVR